MNTIGVIIQNVVGSLVQHEIKIGMASTGITINNITGGNATEEFLKTSASNIWHVMHNRGYKPVVNVLNEAGEEVVADYFHNSVNDFYVLFNSPQKGSVLYT